MHHTPMLLCAVKATSVCYCFESNQYFQINAEFGAKWISENIHVCHGSIKIENQNALKEVQQINEIVWKRISDIKDCSKRFYELKL